MRQFMDEDFLLSTETSRRLYEAAKGEPVFDYHCHLPPREIAEDRRFDNLAALWLGEGNYGDHYKWRVMRANGVDEKLITGTGADPYERYLAWADTVQRLLGNPLYHWTHLELQRYFNIYQPLTRESAPAIWKNANYILKNDPDFSVSGIFKKFRVAVVGTTDDPADSLEWHRQISGGGTTDTRVIPSFRPDRALNLNAPGYGEYITKLGDAAGIKILSLDDLLAVLKNRIEFFDKMGCRASDHGLESVPFEEANCGAAGLCPEEAAASTFKAALAGTVSGKPAAESFKAFVLSFLAGEYAKKGWAMQLHLAAMRNNNTRMFAAIGPDTGYDAVHDHPVAAALSCFLDKLEQKDALPKTVLYSLNFKDFYPLATVMGCFQGRIPGKMQLGSAWWFLDHKDGMEDHLKLLANTGLLSRFIGMLTDSRSFLSYPRHEYFRRILCRLLGDWVENGEVPGDLALLGGMVRDISFGNAQSYFS